jgi:hypothetical protein
MRLASPRTPLPEGVGSGARAARQRADAHGSLSCDTLHGQQRSGAREADTRSRRHRSRHRRRRRPRSTSPRQSRPRGIRGGATRRSPTAALHVLALAAPAGDQNADDRGLRGDRRHRRVPRPNPWTSGAARSSRLSRSWSSPSLGTPIPAGVVVVRWIAGPPELHTAVAGSPGSVGPGRAGVSDRLVARGTGVLRPRRCSGPLGQAASGCTGPHPPNAGGSRRRPLRRVPGRRRRRGEVRRHEDDGRVDRH